MKEYKALHDIRNSKENGAEQMTSRERLSTAIRRHVPDRVPKMDISFWNETVERWRREGLPADVTPDDYFCLEKNCRVTFDSTLRLPERTIEEDDETKLYFDSCGVKYRAYKHKTFPPNPEGSLIQEREDWEQYRHLLDVDFSRVNSSALQKNTENRDSGSYRILNLPEPMWMVLKMLFEPEALMKTLTEPELIKDMLGWYTNFVLGMVDEITSRGYEFDGCWLSSDLCFKTGMIFSPAFFREIVMPFQKKIFNHCHSKKMQIIYHCCGNVNQILPLLIECGIDCIQPMEARAFNDVRNYKRLYGDKIAFMGNISTDVMSTTKEAIEVEIKEKFSIAKAGGGYIYHSDHSIPPTVSFENYCFVMEMVEKYGKY